jgi:hypothetical protein
MLFFPYLFFYILFILLNKVPFDFYISYFGSTCSHVISVRTREIRGSSGNWCCVRLLQLIVTTSPFFIFCVKKGEWGIVTISPLSL